MTATLSSDDTVDPWQLDQTSTLGRRLIDVQSWTCLLATLALYVLANVADARGDAVLIVAGVAMPLAFAGAVHIEVDAQARGRTRTRRAISAGLAVLVIIASGLWSWVHIVRLAIGAGATTWQAVLLPICIDGTMIIALLVIHRRREQRHDEEVAVAAGKRLDLPPAVTDAITREHGVAVSQARTPTTIYRLLNEEGDLLYVGITSDVRTRMASHANTKEWWPQVADVVIRRYPTREQALLLEEHVIATEAPAYNRRIGAFSDSATPHGCWVAPVPPAESVPATAYASSVKREGDAALLDQLQRLRQDNGGDLPPQRELIAALQIGYGRLRRLLPMLSDDADTADEPISAAGADVDR